MSQHTSNTSAVATKDTAKVEVRATLPNLTLSRDEIREGYPSLKSAQADAVRTRKVSQDLERVQGLVLQSAALTMHRARCGDLIGSRDDQVTATDFVATLGYVTKSDPHKGVASMATRLSTIGRGVVDWGIEPGTDAYTALVSAAYGHGGKDRADQRGAIVTALKGDPDKDQDREALERAISAWVAGPPKSQDQGDQDQGEGDQGEGEGGDTRTPREGDHTPKSGSEAVGMVRTVPQALALVESLGDLLAQWTREDRETVLSALVEMAARFGDDTPALVAGTVVES